jgi:hypothetical protein
VSNKVVHLFVNVSMSYGHKGLAETAQKEKVDIRTLKVGEFALFANKALTALKLFGANNTVIHYKAPTNRPIDIRAIKYIPHFLSGADIGYDRALLEVFRRKYSHLYRHAE